MPPLPGPVEYLVIGHLTKDLTSEGPILGGTASYSGLTARAHGLQVGILTSFGSDLDIGPLDEVEVFSVPSKESTTFRNIYEETGRKQVLKAQATGLASKDIPKPWRMPDIVHIAPIADEVDFDFIDTFKDRFICMTPQGWLRRWDQDGEIYPASPDFLFELLPSAQVVVFSQEDLPSGESVLSELTSHCERLVLTSGPDVVSVYERGARSEYSIPTVTSVDATGAGDIFATALFIHFYYHRDLPSAVEHAIKIAAYSVTRVGLESCPTADELKTFKAISTR
jgi:hypothetical protein